MGLFCAADVHAYIGQGEVALGYSHRDLFAYKYLY